MRRLSAGLGAGALAFGLLPAVWPTYFARMFDIACAQDATVKTAIRSVGVRDAVIGLGLLRAALSPGDRSFRAWLLARAACDAGDTVGVGLAVLEGRRTPRFLALGALALGATVVGGLLASRTPR